MNKMHTRSTKLCDHPAEGFLFLFLQNFQYFIGGGRGSGIVARRLPLLATLWSLSGYMGSVGPWGMASSSVRTVPQGETAPTMPRSATPTGLSLVRIFSG